MFFLQVRKNQSNNAPLPGRCYRCSSKFYLTGILPQRLATGQCLTAWIGLASAHIQGIMPAKGGQVTVLIVRGERLVANRQRNRRLFVFAKRNPPERAKAVAWYRTGRIVILYVYLDHLVVFAVPHVFHRNGHLSVRVVGVGISKAGIAQAVSKRIEWLAVVIPVGTVRHGVVFKVRQILLRRDRR